MKLQLLSLSLIAAIVGSPIFARAQSISDGNTLKQECSISSSPPRRTMTDSEAMAVVGCINLVRGVMETLLIWDVTDRERRDADLHGCIPPEVTRLQAVAIVTKYLNGHPEKLQLGDTVLTRVALVQAFPCKT
jgi:hypothetical protein